ILGCYTGHVFRKATERTEVTDSHREAEKQRRFWLLKRLRCFVSLCDPVASVVSVIRPVRQEARGPRRPTSTPARRAANRRRRIRRWGWVPSPRTPAGMAQRALP